MAKRKSRSRKSSNANNLSKVLSVPSGMCKHCGSSPCCCHSKGIGWIVLILGVLFLIKDLGGFYWWTVNWWTVLFIIYGIWMIKK
ncbi:MAG: hypothetical protein AABX08_03935 [Nanoarchaeota archaeon]